MCAGRCRRGASQGNAHTVARAPHPEADRTEVGGRVPHADLPARLEPPVRRAGQQVQFVAPLVHQGMAQHEGEVRRPGHVRDRVAPGKTPLEVNAFGKRVAGRGVEQVPVEVLDELLVFAADQGSHRGVGREVRVDDTAQAGPADGALDKTAAVLFAGVGERGRHARIVGGEQLGRPERFGVAPVRARLFPTGREMGQAGPLPGGVDRPAVVRPPLHPRPAASAVSPRARAASAVQSKPRRFQMS